MPSTVALVPNTPFAWQDRADGSAEVTLDSRAARALVFQPHGCHMSVGMQLWLRRGPIDISIQPGLAWRLVRDAATERDIEPVRLTQTIVRRLVPFASTHGLWAPRDLESTGGDILVGMSFPLLGAALDHGAGGVAEVPRWAAPALRCPTAREAARSVFGSNASRRVTAALASSLVPASHVNARFVALYPVASALMGCDVLDADRLAAVLESGTNFVESSKWPDVELVALGRAQLPSLGARRAVRLLTDATTIANGPALLSETLINYKMVRAQLRPPAPHGLLDLHGLCRSLLAVDPAPERHLIRPRAARHAPAELRAAEQAVRRTFSIEANPVPPPPTALAPWHAYPAPAVANRDIPVFRYAPAVAALDGLQLPNGDLEPGAAPYPR